MSYFDGIVATMDAEIFSVFGTKALVTVAGTPYLIDALFDVSIERVNVDGFSVRRSELTYKTADVPKLSRGDLVELDEGKYKITEVESLDATLSIAVINRL